MKLLITGANGHVGANLVREALADGHTVRALVRSTSDRTALDGLEIEVVEGDILEPATLGPACDGVDAVIHAAAVYRNWAADEQVILRPAIEGTENVLRAASEAGVERVVYTSSTATIGFTPDRTPLDESHHTEDAKAIYIRAKVEAERVALRLADTLGIEVVVVNPGGIMGPWDIKITPTSRAVIDMTGGGPAVLDVCVTHVADVARGHLLALEKGVSGERYILTAENLTREQVAELMSELTGTRVKPMVPPRFLMRMIAWWEVRKARSSGADAGITGNQIADVYGRSLFYDNTKAREQLGWTGRPARDTLVDTLAWLAQRGELPAAVASTVAELRSSDPHWPAA